MNIELVPAEVREFVTTQKQKILEDVRPQVITFQQSQIKILNE